MQPSLIIHGWHVKSESDLQGVWNAQVEAAEGSGGEAAACTLLKERWHALESDAAREV